MVRRPDSSRKTTEWLDAEAATRLLDVNRATLYAYVSRGFVRSEPVPGRPRERRYAREDVDRLRVRAEERRNPEKAVAHALRWGVPILESAITLIADGKIYYRGQDASVLARTRSLEEVAALVWCGAFDADVFDTPLHVVSGLAVAPDLPFINRAQSILPLVAARDSLAFDLRPRNVAQTGWRIVNLLTSVAAASQHLEGTVEETLAREWAPKRKDAAKLIRAALIVCADHELNVSSFTARCVASAGSNPFSVALAGLAAIEGTKHGGMSARIETMLDELRRARDLKKALADRLRRGEPVDGFGHPLYPAGDPRAALLLSLATERFPSKELTFAKSVAKECERLFGEKPTIDFALVALARTLKLPPGAPLTLFAIGRTIGWIGHAIEQYAANAIIRPRARYVGKQP
jgi:citrate synthase